MFCSHAESAAANLDEPIPGFSKGVGSSSQAVRTQEQTFLMMCSHLSLILFVQCVFSAHSGVLFTAFASNKPDKPKAHPRIHEPTSQNI